MLLDRFTQVLALAAWLGLVACVNPAVPADAAPARQEGAAVTDHVRSDTPVRNRCDAQAARFLLGQPYGPDTLRRALDAAGADEARMLRPDSVVTKEYQTGRLNVVVDAAGRVLQVHCG